MAQWVNGLLHSMRTITSQAEQPEFWIPSTWVKAGCIYSPGTGRVETGGSRGAHWPSSLAEMVNFRFTERTVSKNKVESDGAWRQSLPPHVHAHTNTHISVHTHTHTHKENRSPKLTNKRWVLKQLELSLFDGKRFSTDAPIRHHSRIPGVTVSKPTETFNSILERYLHY